MVIGALLVHHQLGLPLLPFERQIGPDCLPITGYLALVEIVADPVSKQFVGSELPEVIAQAAKQTQMFCSYLVRGFRPVRWYVVWNMPTGEKIAGLSIRDKIITVH